MTRDAEFEAFRLAMEAEQYPEDDPVSDDSFAPALTTEEYYRLNPEKSGSDVLVHVQL